MCGSHFFCVGARIVYQFILRGFLGSLAFFFLFCKKKRHLWLCNSEISGCKSARKMRCAHFVGTPVVICTGRSMFLFSDGNILLDFQVAKNVIVASIRSYRLRQKVPHVVVEALDSQEAEHNAGSTLGNGP